MSTRWKVLTALSWTDAEIRRLIAVPAIPSNDVERLSPATAEKLLTERLKKIFIPTAQTLAVISRVLSTGRAHLHLHYPDSNSYLRGVNARASPLEALDAVCITGLPGIGKSSLAKSLQRLVASDPLIVDPGAGYPSVKFDFLWSITVDSRKRLRQLLEEPLDGRLLDLDRLNSESRVIGLASRLAFRHGLSFLVADEWQFLTQGSESNALLTKLLHSLRYIGVPVFFIANYSLCRRLLKRPAEDQHRLLQDPIVMLPDAVDSPTQDLLYSQYRLATNGFMDIETKQHGEMIHDFTQGVSRSRIRLLSIAYRIARERHAPQIGPRDLEDAYRSLSFASFRGESERIRIQHLPGASVDSDMSCPLPLSVADTAPRQRHEESREQARLMEQALMSSTTKSEREQLTRLQPLKREATAPQAKRKPKPTFEDLIEGARRFDAMKKAPKPR